MRPVHRLSGSGRRERSILNQNFDIDALHALEACLSISDILAIMAQVPQVRRGSVDDYIPLALVHATPAKRRGVEVGVSTRGALALRKAVQTHALLQGRDYATPDDVKALAVPVLAHRLIFSSDQLSDPHAQSERLIESLLQETPAPALNLAFWDNCYSEWILCG